MNKKSNHYTLMFIPENNGKTFTLRVHKYIVRSLLAFFVVFVLCLTMLLYKSGEIAAKLQMLYIIKLENEKLTNENKQLREITNKFDKIEAMSNYLNRLVNPPSLARNNTPVDTTGDVQFAENADQGESSDQKELYNSSNSDNIKTSKDDLKSIPNILPVDGWITRQFTKSSDSLHQGIDYAATTGTPIKSSAPGIVEDIKNDSFLGLLVTINHENGFITKYGHCSQVIVSKHDRVKRGQTIAFVGNTGRSTAPHLHYELLKDGVNVDPSKYLLTSK